jgi:hypothetical protein
VTQLHDAMRAHFLEQAVGCEAYGSPFTGRLIERMLADFDAGGPVAKLLEGWTGHPRADAVSLRLAGALHAAALIGRDAALRGEYPEQRPQWDAEAVWTAARAFLEREQAWVAAFIESAPQTNETARTIALLPGFLAFAGAHGGAFDTLELGASAGLNLNWERFHYRAGGWSWGPQRGVVIETAWDGPAPALEVTPRIRQRAACDLNPLDVGDAEQRMRLRSYIWPDQAARLARFDAAAKLAIETGVRVERADAAEWVAERLARREPGVGTLVYHSVFLQYPPREKQLAIKAAIEEAGRRASAESPVAWLRLEPEALLGGPRDSLRFLVDLTTWPGGERRVLAVTDGHARTVAMQ